MDTIIARKLQNLNTNVQELKKYQNYRYDEIKGDLQKIWAIERGLQISIQIVIDIGNHILASINKNQIDSYSDIIIQLGECDILPIQFAEQIKGMAGLRNLLVHRYADVDLRQIYDFLQNRLDDFTEYIRHIQSYLLSKN